MMMEERIREGRLNIPTNSRLEGERAIPEGVVQSRVKLKNIIQAKV